MIDSGADVIVIDTAHGHSIDVIKAVKRLKKEFSNTQVIAGNVVTPDATKELIDVGADGIKVGIGPGSICTTRIIAGVGIFMFVWSLLGWSFEPVNEETSNQKDH